MPVGHICTCPDPLIRKLTIFLLLPGAFLFLEGLQLTIGPNTLLTKNFPRIQRPSRKPKHQGLFSVTYGILLREDWLLSSYHALKCPASFSHQIDDKDYTFYHPCMHLCNNSSIHQCICQLISKNQLSGICLLCKKGRL